MIVEAEDGAYRFGSVVRFSHIASVRCDADLVRYRQHGGHNLACWRLASVANDPDVT
jgi:hypothetical protein